MQELRLRHDLLYRSEVQAHVRYVNGERKEEPYYLYYLFREDGIWLCQTTDSAHLEVPDLLADVDLAVVLSDPDHDEPMTRARELRYQCGRYEVRDGTVYITWKHSQLEEKERTWHFRIRSEKLIETDFGEVRLHLAGA